jgi:hypothetical protein
MARGEDWKTIRKIANEDMDITYIVVRPWSNAVMRA